MLENLSTIRKLCSVWNKNTRVGQTLKEQARPHLLWHFKPGKGLCFLMLYWQMWELLAKMLRFTAKFRLMNGVKDLSAKREWAVTMSVQGEGWDELRAFLISFVLLK